MGRPSVLAEWYDTSLAEVSLLDFDPSHISAFASSIANTLHFAHSQYAVIHQDIKPSNILIDATGDPHVADFGIATFAPSQVLPGDPIDVSYTRTITNGAISGTPYYMAPELLFSRAAPSVLTDIYSFGVMFVTVITGEHPYLSNVPGMFSTTKATVISRLAVLSPRLPRHFGDLLLACVSLDPRNRPHSWADIVGALEGHGPRRTRVSPDDRLDTMIAQVRMYRSKRDWTSARRIIDEAIRLFPTDPAVLNSLGLLLVAQDRLDDSFDALTRAVNYLRVTNGQRHNYPYPDPLMNLAAMLIRMGRFEEAAVHIQLGESWLAAVPPGEAQPRTRNLDLFYPELAWLAIWQGDLRKAIAHLQRVRDFRSPDSTWLKWAVVAGMGNSVDAPYWVGLYDAARTVAVSDLGSALAVCVVGAQQDGERLSTLLHRLPTDLDCMIAHMEYQRGVCKMGLRPPRDARALGIALAAIDLEVTGGRLYGDV
jgi:tetratricopeptide (TPR) repeat protein